jgi:hypothetical protein
MPILRFEGRFKLLKTRRFRFYDIKRLQCSSSDTIKNRK